MRFSSSMSIMITRPKPIQLRLLLANVDFLVSVDLLLQLPSASDPTPSLGVKRR